MSSGNKQSKYRALLKDTFVFVLGSIGSKVILFLLVPLYTNYLSTDEYGIADLVFTFSQILIPIFSVMIYSAVLRFGLSKQESVNNVLLSGYIVLIAGTLLSFLALPLIGLYGALSEWKIHLIIYVAIYNFSSLNLSFLKVREKNLKYAIISLIQTLVLALTNVILLVFLKLGVNGYLLANIAAVFVSFVISFFVGKIPAYLKNSRFDKLLFKRMLLYSSPLILNDLSWWIIHSSDKIMIEQMIDANVLGIYTVATKIPSLINVLISVFSQSWGISAIKEVEDSNDKSFYSTIFKFQLYLCFFALISIVLVLKPFMTIYVSNSFFEAWLYVPALLMASLFSSISTFYGSIYGAIKKNLNSMITTIVGALVNIALNYVLIKFIGIWGVLIGTVASQFVIAFLRMFNSRRFVKFEINWIILCLNILNASLLVLLVSNGINIYLCSGISLGLFLIINIKTTKEIFDLLKVKLRRKNVS